VSSASITLTQFVPIGAIRVKTPILCLLVPFSGKSPFVYFAYFAVPDPELQQKVTEATKKK